MGFRTNGVFGKKNKLLTACKYLQSVLYAGVFVQLGFVRVGFVQVGFDSMFQILTARQSHGTQLVVHWEFLQVHWTARFYRQSETNE